MSATTTTASTFKFVRRRGFEIRPHKPISYLQFPSSNLAAPAGFVSMKAVRKSMTESVKTSAFGSNSGDDSVRAFEQEALVNGSSGFTAHGLQSTLNNLSKWLVAGLFAAVLLWRHDAESLWAASGSVINSVISLALKRVLNQARPVSTLRSDPGMPSSHAQSIAFTVFFIIISILEWQGVNEITLSASVLALAIGSYLCWLRVSQQFHTISQVVVGTAGCCLGFILHVIRDWFREEVRISHILGKM
ncbi:lipid phosphate phosphatase epsilon 2, chloroplastic-like isoform X2 [Tripterygium wilfordii]|uniref:lipid phosphate phosphatase epsilon 2, chloroplastic-like isoform X2 n=1 Tax=Tripterygium wilfordii TaxID=458696 RepID=UPI0018F811AF|nr:lipid phosphate phosphatase epsilon 2, chloroplastic-like isoform X2 [Tripterygium wilfordii]